MYNHLIDNNVFDLMIKDYSFYANYYKNLETKGYITKKNFIIATPFAFLESLGVKFPKNNNISLDLRLSNKLIEDDMNTKLIQRLRRKLFYDFYKYAEQQLPRKIIKQKFNEKLHYISPSLVTFYKNIFAGFLKDFDGVKLIYKKFAVDRVYAFNYPPKLKNTMHTVYISEVYEHLYEEENVSLFRGVRKMAIELSDFAKNDGKNELFEGLIDIVRKTHIEKHEEFLDTEIIHYSTVGLIRNKKTQPVLCITLEGSDRELFLEGIKFYKWFLKNSYDRLLEIKWKKFDLITPSNGKLIFINKRAEIVEEWNIADINWD